MKAVVVREPFGLDGIVLEERPDPGPPGPGQLLVRVKAAALNWRDLLVSRGEDRWRPPAGRILGSDAAAEVLAVGDGVERWRPGDRVLTPFLPGWLSGPLDAPKIAVGSLGSAARDGVFAERLLVDAECVVAAPRHMTDAEASTLVCAGVTAWHALSKAGLFEGRSCSVLVQGTGGVATFALQIAAAAGAEVIATSSSDAKLERALALGADAGINYRRTPAWAAEAMRLTDGRGVEHVVDIGGSATLAESVAATAYEGVVSLVGLIGGRTASLDVVSVFLRNIRLQGIETGSRDMLDGLARWSEHEKLKPVVGAIHPVDDVRSAFEDLASGRTTGKICLSF